MAQTWLASFHMGALLRKIIFLRFLLSSKDSFFSASVTWTCKRQKNDPLKIVACSRKLNLIHMHHIVTSFHYYTKLRCDQIFSINNFSAISLARPLVWDYPPVYLHLIFWNIECHLIFFQFRNIKFKKSKNQFDFEIDFCRLHRQ